MLLSGGRRTLEKNSSFVGGLKIGASKAKLPDAKVVFAAILLTNPLDPMIAWKSGWKT